MLNLKKLKKFLIFWYQKISNFLLSRIKYYSIKSLVKQCRPVIIKRSVRRSHFKIASFHYRKFIRQSIKLIYFYLSRFYRFSLTKLKLYLQSMPTVLAIILLLLQIGATYHFIKTNIILYNQYQDYQLAKLNEVTTKPTEVKIDQSAFNLDFVNATGLTHKINAYAVSPKLASQVGLIKNIDQIKSDFLVVDASPVQFQEAKVKLRKLASNDKVSAIITCADSDYDRKNNICNNWQIFDTQFTDQDGYISFTTTHFSVYAAAYLEILNYQSELVAGDNWTVYFKTYGQSDLTIQPTAGTEFNKDLQFIALYCGDTEIPNAFQGDKVFVSNYTCDNEISYITNKTLTGGEHELEFKFADYDLIARNFACDSSDSGGNCIVNTPHSLQNNETINNPTGASCPSTICTNLDIKSGGSLNATATNIFNINMSGDVTIESGASIAGNFYATSTNLTLNSGGNISAVGMGYTGGASTTNGNGTGFGNGGTSDYNNIAGGGGGGGAVYGGGTGGTGGWGYPNLPGGAGGSTLYGSNSAPLNMGSGGGGGGNGTTGNYLGIPVGFGNTGGGGGGIIKLNVTGTTTINGSFNASGASGGSGGYQGDWLCAGAGGGGGGSGGSIWINTNSLTGTGTISSIGGAGGTGGVAGTFCGTSYGGGGGGAGGPGRIAIYATTSSYTGLVSASGGGNTGNSSGASINGGAGGAGGNDVGSGFLWTKPTTISIFTVVIPYLLRHLSIILFLPPPALL